MYPYYVSINDRAGYPEDGDSKFLRNAAHDVTVILFSH
jgi:hypothetical protein